MHIDTLIKYIKKIRKNRRTKQFNRQSIIDFSLALEQYLEGRNANIDAQGSDGYTMLAWAVFKDLVPIVELLLEQGAHPDAQNILNESALMWAAYGRNLQIVKLLIQANVKIDAKDHFGLTALDWAAFYNNNAVIELLIEQGASIVNVLMTSASPSNVYFIGHDFLYHSLEKANRKIPAHLFSSQPIEDEIIAHNTNIDEHAKHVSAILIAENKLAQDASHIVMGYLFEQFKVTSQIPSTHSVAMRNAL